MNVELPHVCPCLLPVSLENGCSGFVDNFDVGANEDYCASCVAEYSHAEQVVGEGAHDVTVFGSRR